MNQSNSFQLPSHHADSTTACPTVERLSHSGECGVSYCTISFFVNQSSSFTLFHCLANMLTVRQLARLWKNDHIVPLRIILYSRLINQSWINLTLFRCLAIMLTVRQLARLWKDDHIAVNAAYPGVCSTNIKRHMGVDKSITGRDL